MKTLLCTVQKLEKKVIKFITHTANTRVDSKIIDLMARRRFSVKIMVGRVNPLQLRLPLNVCENMLNLLVII